ncbi:MAG: glycosyltransferase family 4 protein [Coriobacteriia bacterium]
MRILYIHQFFATRESSHPTRSYEFARRMVADGHEVVMVTGGSRLPAPYGERLFARLDIDGIDVRSVKGAYSNHMGYGRRMLAFLLFVFGGTWLALRAPRPDVVFATSTPLTAGIPGLVASKLRRVPLVFEVRDPWPEAAIQMGALKRGGLIARVAKRLERRLYRDSAAVVGLSPGMVDCILAEGTDPAKIHMIPNCSDLDLFHPGPKDPGLEERYDLAGRFVVGYTGAIGPANAVGTIARAALLLRDRERRDIVVLVAGDGKRLPAVIAYKERHTLDGLRIIGSVPKKDMPALLRTCDVVLSHLAKVPILYTGSPNKLFDGLATGKPIIVNSPGWTRPLVVDNGAGLYVPPEDPHDLADAIEKLADDPEACVRMGRAARALAERDFDRDVLARRLTAVLEDAAKKRGEA